MDIEVFLTEFLKRFLLTTMRTFKVKYRWDLDIRSIKYLVKLQINCLSKTEIMGLLLKPGPGPWTRTLKKNGFWKTWILKNMAEIWDLKICLTLDSYVL